jgi:hypothetical protein
VPFEDDGSQFAISAVILRQARLVIETELAVLRLGLHPIKSSSRKPGMSLYL